MSGPISPKEVATMKANTFPSEVFDAFNELIAKKFVNGSANVKQKDVVNLIKEKMNDKPFSYDWLNVEAAYEALGWEVSYDKPAYCESYEANFDFRSK